jgi:predicted O-methyltransferase YrrM
MNPIIEAIYRDQSLTATDGTVHQPFPVSIKRNEGEALYHLVRTIKPAATLEVGTAWGLSTLFICQALADNPLPLGHHTAIDPYQSRFHYMGLENIKRAGLHHLLTFIEQSSHLALPQLVQQKKSFDVIFIDGSHLFDGVFVDFFYADQLLPVGGHLVFDDLWMPAVRKTLHFILTNRDYKICPEFLGPKPPTVKSFLQNLRYQTKKKLKGKSNHGAPPESRFHLRRNVNWCVLQKTASDSRPWDHFAAF